MSHSVIIPTPSSSEHGSPPFSPDSYSSFTFDDAASSPFATSSLSVLPTHIASSPSPSTTHFPFNLPSSLRSGRHSHRSGFGLRISNPLARLRPASIVGNVANRTLRTLKSRDGITLVLFVTSLCYFFAALCGVGYVEPSPSSLNGLVRQNETLPEFALAAPLLSQREVRAKVQKTQKERELSWQKMVRSKSDGAWLRPKDLSRRSIIPKPLAAVGSEDTQALDREIVSADQ